MRNNPSNSVLVHHAYRLYGQRNTFFYKQNRKNQYFPRNLVVLTSYFTVGQNSRLRALFASLAIKLAETTSQSYSANKGIIYECEPKYLGIIGSKGGVTKPYASLVSRTPYIHPEFQEKSDKSQSI